MTHKCQHCECEYEPEDGIHHCLYALQEKVKGLLLQNTELRARVKELEEAPFNLPGAVEAKKAVLRNHDLEKQLAAIRLHWECCQEREVKLIKKWEEVNRENDALKRRLAGLLPHRGGTMSCQGPGCPFCDDEEAVTERPKCDSTGPCEEGHVCDERREVCWFAEVNHESKNACSTCKDMAWPNPGWISSKGLYLTSDPREARKFKTRKECLEWEGKNPVRHLHLYETEHVFLDGEVIEKREGQSP